MDKRVIFKAEHICAGYDNKDVIHDISFSVQPNTLCALIGANGSGKTTLMRSIAGRLEHRGSCYLKGENLESMSLRNISQKVSYIPQKSGISISLPCLDVVLMGFNPVLRLMQNPSKDQINRAKAAMDLMGLAGLEETDYLKLSEGQKQLVILARTLIEDTSLMLLDEPDSALDIQNRNQMMKLLHNMVKSADRAGILCLHDPMLALNNCEQLVLLKEGICTGILHPLTDDIKEMEDALRQIYDDISLVECAGRKGRRKLVVLWEDEE